MSEKKDAAGFDLPAFNRAFGLSLRMDRKAGRKENPGLRGACLFCGQRWGIWSDNTTSGRMCSCARKVNGGKRR